MGDSVVGLARSFLSSCTGYFWAPAWRTEAERLAGLLKSSCAAATAAADQSEALLDARALTAGSGNTALRAAVAEAGTLAKQARQAAADAGAGQTAVAKLLRDNAQPADALGDLAGTVQAAEAAADRAELARKSLQAAGQPSDAWHALQARLSGGLQIRITALGRSPASGTTDPLVEAHRRLCNELEKGAKPPFQPDKVQAAVDTVTAGLPKLEQALAGLEAKSGGADDTRLAALRQAALQQFDSVRAGYGLDDVKAKLLTKMQGANPKLKPQHLAAVTRRQDTAPERLAAALRTAPDPAAISAALDEALRAYRESVAGLATNVANGSVLPLAEGKAGAALAAEADVARYEARLGETDQALAELRIAGAPSYAASRKQRDAIVEQTAKTGDYAAAAASALPALLTQIQDQENAHRDETEPQVEALRAEVEALRAELTKARRRPDAARADTLLATVAANLDEADNFLDCNGNIEAADPARGLIADVKALLADMQSASGTFAALASALASIKDGLGHADLKAIPGADLAELTRRHAELKDPASGLTVTELKTAVEGLQASLTAQTQFGGALKAWRAAGSQTLKALTTTFDGYAQAVKATPTAQFTGGKPDPAKGDIRATLDGMTALLAASVGSAEFDAHGDAWTQAAQRATDGLAAVWDAGGKTLKDLAAATADAAAGVQRAADAAAVTQDWQALDAKMEGYAQLVAAANGNTGEYQLLVRQLAAVPRQIADDPDAARAQLADIGKRLEAVRGTPDFDGAVARAVGKIPAEWGAVLDHTGRQLDALVQAVEAAAQATAFAGGMAELRRLAAGIKARFAADAFTAAATELAQPDPTGAKRRQRRALREDGLRRLGDYQAQLFDDPLFRHLQENPFGVPVFGPLFRFLDRVELEFLRVAT